MKKFTFMLLTAFIAVAAMAAGPGKRNMTKEATPFMPQVQLGQKISAKQAPSELVSKIQTSSRARARKKAVSAADLVGDYTWNYQTANETSTDLDAIEKTAGSAHVTISESTTTEGGITITGMFPNSLEATVVSSEDSGDYFQIAAGQVAGSSSYGDYVLNGMFFYEGDDETAGGWYFGDIFGYVQEDGSIVINPWMCRVLTGGQYDGYSLTPYWVEGSTLTLADPLAPVVAPEGLETDEYIISARNYKDDADVGGSVQIGFDGNDVYVQGLCTYLPEAWVKGTLDGTTVTFPFGQYFGNYGGSYDMFLNVLMGTDVVFTYDAEAGTLTAQNEFFLVDNNQYYFDSYRGCVLKKVVEQAAMPANPTITGLQETQYGYVISFNVPNVDVNGDGLVAEKLSYKLYTDIEGEIAPLTFTPETHSRLTESMTEIPYGFTEGYDFYNGQIYLNDLYSADWNNIGIQSTYTGGDEVNTTEIQWFHIKDYYVPATGDFTFDFNHMDVSTSASGVNDGDIIDDTDFIVGNVTMTVSTSTTNTPNRFWSTTAGPQLRVYGGTLTFSVPEGSTITQIVFNHNGKWGANTVEGVEIPNDTDNKVATWAGEAQKVVVTVAANSQINSIVVTVAGGGDQPQPGGDSVTYTFEDGTLEGWTSIDADGDGFGWENTQAAGSGLSAHNGSTGAVYSKSYDSNAGALTPDNYLVSPKVQLGSKFSFFAVAQDASYPSEHFGVFVSTTGTNPEDFTMVEEWTLTKARYNKFSTLNKRSNAPRKAQGNWYQYIVDLSQYEGQEGYVAIRHFDCTDNFYMLIDDITFGTPADPDPEPVPDELVVLPEGVEPAEYTLTAAGATSQGAIDIEQTVNVAFDGSDVYLQGLAYYFPEAYVKGTLTEDGQVVVPSGQFVGEDKYGVEYIVALDVNEEGNFIDAESFAFDYDAESGVLTLTGMYGESGTKNSSSLWDYFDEATFTPGALVLPDVVEAPEGLETETWYFIATNADGKAVRGNELQIGTDGSDMYVQGLCEYLPEAWVKGTVAEDGTVTFASGQFYGTYNDQYNLFFVGYDSEAKEISDVVFTFDEEGKTMTTNQWIILNGKQSALSVYDYFTDITISSEQPEIPEAVVAPEDLATEPYYFQGIDTYRQKETSKEVQVGFYGENEVYIQGLSSYVPEAWVVGTVEGNTITIPETYLGIYASFFGETEVFFSGATFVYDAEAGTFTSEDGFVSYETPDDEYMMDEYVNVVLTKLQDVAATPATPTIVGIKTVGTNYPNVTFDIPTVDVNGTPIIASKLAYQLYVEKDGQVEPLVLDADIYDQLEEDMSEIPYTFSDDWDIYNYKVYLNQGAEEIATWSKIGIQTIYYGGNEVNKSEIAWHGLDIAVNVGTALYATYVAPVDVTFIGSEAEAFTVTINEQTGCATLNPVTNVPAGTAVVVKAAREGTYAAYKTEGAVLDAENQLVAATEDVVADGAQYILALKEEGVGFFQATAGTTIAAGKGYLVINATNAKAFYPFSDDATGIQGIFANENNEAIYNLAGQRIGKIQKGINIIGGKKILK